MSTKKDDAVPTMELRFVKRRQNMSFATFETPLTLQQKWLISIVVNGQNATRYEWRDVPLEPET